MDSTVYILTVLRIPVTLVRGVVKYELDGLISEWFKAFVAWLFVTLFIMLSLSGLADDIAALHYPWDILFEVIPCAWLLWALVIELFVLAFVVKAWWRFFLVGIASIVSLLFLEVALNAVFNFGLDMIL